jgi:hypothetical protein
MAVWLHLLLISAKEKIFDIKFAIFTYLLLSLPIKYFYRDMKKDIELNILFLHDNTLRNFVSYVSKMGTADGGTVAKALR